MLTFFRKIRKKLFEELRNTGTMNLIKNSNLRSNIVQYYSSIDSRSGRIDKRRGFYPYKSYQLVPRSTDSQDDEFFYKSDVLSNKRIIESIFKSDLKDHLVAELNLAQFIGLSCQSLLHENSELQKQIAKTHK